jgi:hypothetical protein
VDIDTLDFWVKDLEKLIKKIIELLIVNGVKIYKMVCNQCVD